MRLSSIGLLVAAEALTATAFAQSSRPSDTMATSSGDVTVTPIMHTSVLLRAGGKVIYIDPLRAPMTVCRPQISSSSPISTAITFPQPTSISSERPAPSFGDRLP